MPASEGTVSAKPVLAPASSVEQQSTPYRYWWLVILLLSVGGWGIVLSAGWLLWNVL